MPAHQKIRVLAAAFKNLALHPLDSLRTVAHRTQSPPPAGHATPENRANRFADAWIDRLPKKQPGGAATHNPLQAYFDGIQKGPGVWKWLHYFEPYHRHLKKFIGQNVTVVEVGVYSGGSMPMWRKYWGDSCQVHGVDIEPSCKAYENDHTKIHIGDQACRAFWADFRKDVPSLDVLIDDGGHSPEQQMVTLEEMLPHLRPGGVYICEDITGVKNEFSVFVHALADRLNAYNLTTGPKGHVSPSSPLQASIHSVHFYPFMVVIEKADFSMPTLSAPKHGTQWQPYL